jgi:hypothetical protein
MRTADRSAGTLRVVLCAAVLAAGCTTWQWQKPGADAAALEHDLDECQQQASARSYRFALSASPELIVTPGGAAGLVRPTHAVPPLDPALQSDLLDACMRAKGYRLVPRR